MYAHKNNFSGFFILNFFCDLKKFRLTTTSRRIECQCRVEVDVLNGDIE